jgi:N-acetyl-anhydromuramyl-L-alanine amidase AmpD
VSLADHPDVPFLLARGFTPGRPDGPALWWVLHEWLGEAESAQDLADHFSTDGDAGRSAHYCFDQNTEVQCVRLRDCAWMVGNRPGDRRGIGALLVGFGYYQSEAEWLDEPGRRTLARVARVAARDMQRYRIPARWCTVDDLAALRPGLTTRYDLQQAFGFAVPPGGSPNAATDPESSFPRDHLLARIISETASDSFKTGVRAGA